MDRPKIVCLCGSSRFVQEMAVIAWELEKEEAIVLSLHLLPAWYKTRCADHLAEAEGVADRFNDLHLRKIDLADRVMVVNVGGYVGDDTRREIAYCRKIGKPLTFLEPEPDSPVPPPPERINPKIVCLCGSTRFWREFQSASLRETLAGNIVLSIGAASGTDDEHFGDLPRVEYEAVKARLDELHLRKIDLADEVLILNVGGYIGESTARELAYARKCDKPVRFLEPERNPVRAPPPPAPVGSEGLRRDLVEAKANVLDDVAQAAEAAAKKVVDGEE